MKFRLYIFSAVGFFLSINQGFNMIVGTLSYGYPRGADVFMPIDLPLYILLFIKPDSSIRTRFRTSLLGLKILLVAFFLWTVTGEFVAEEPAEFRFALVYLARALLLFYVLVTRLSKREELYYFVWGLLAGVGFQSLIGMWQWQIGPVVLPFWNVRNSWRSTGTIGVPNAFGAYLIAFIPILVRMAFFTEIKYKILWMGVVVMALGSLFATFTRGAWLALVVTMVIYFIIDLRKKKLSRKQKQAFLILSMIFALAMSVKYGHVITDRLSNSKEALVSSDRHSRIGLARDAIRIMRAHPVFGVGLNNYRYHADKRTQGTKIVHNLYLLVWSQQGTPGFVFFMLIHGLIFIIGRKVIAARDPIVYHMGVGVLSGYTGLMIYHMVAPDYRLPMVLLSHYAVGGLAVGIAAVASIQRKQVLRQVQINWLRQQLVSQQQSSSSETGSRESGSDSRHSPPVRQKMPALPGSGEPHLPPVSHR